MTSSSEFGSTFRAAKAGTASATAQTAAAIHLVSDMGSPTPETSRVISRSAILMKTGVNNEKGWVGDGAPGGRDGSGYVRRCPVRIPTNHTFRSAVDAGDGHDRSRGDRRQSFPGGFSYRDRLSDRDLRHHDGRLENADIRRSVEEGLRRRQRGRRRQRARLRANHGGEQENQPNAARRSSGDRRPSDRSLPADDQI